MHYKCIGMSKEIKLQEVVFACAQPTQEVLHHVSNVFGETIWKVCRKKVGT
jgi:hypothetical protein